MILAQAPPSFSMMHAEKRGTLVKFIAGMTSDGSYTAPMAPPAKYLPPDITNVINFTRLPRFSACIIERRGGVWRRGGKITDD